MITKFDATWAGYGWAKPKRWMLKKDIPRQNPGVRPVRLAFAFEVAYVLRDQNGAVLMDGNGGLESWCPAFDFYLNEFGRVIGPQDLQAAQGYAFEAAWRNAAADKRLEATR